jgi:uncharacterized membrane protein
MDTLLNILEYISLGIGIVAVIVIIWGVITGLIELARAELSRFKASTEKSVRMEKVRHDIGFHLLVGLEFLIAADIIRTIVKPTLEELAILGVIVAIRTVIGYFLGKEIGHYGGRP